MARKRGPPKPRQSYAQKYRQIKESGFEVSIKRTDKALISKYHRIIFGGRTKSGKYTVGLKSHYTPLKSKHKDILQQFTGDRRISRIKSALLPKEFHVTKITKRRIYIRSKYETRIVERISKANLISNPISAISHLRGSEYRIQVGFQLTSGNYDAGSLSDRLIFLLDKYGDNFGKSINIVQVKHHNQASNGEYKRAKRRKS